MIYTAKPIRTPYIGFIIERNVITPIIIDKIVPITVEIIEFLVGLTNTLGIKIIAVIIIRITVINRW